MAAVQPLTTTDRYANCIERSKRVRWDIDDDVIRGRALDIKQKFLPDGLSLVNDLEFLSADEQRFLSQVQGRTYANMFGLIERYINAKILEISRDHLRICLQLAEPLNRCLQCNQNVRERHAEVSLDGRIREVALPAGNGQFARKVIQQRIGESEIAFRVFEVDRIDLVRHRRRADLILL